MDEPQRNLLSGSYDFAGTWTLIDDATLGLGTLGFLVEGGQILSHNRGEDLSANVGSIFGINDDLDTTDIAVTELWWSHTLLGESLIITLGKLDQTVFFDANAIANDETAQFLATPLVNNAAVAFPDNGLGANVMLAPADWLYVTAGFGDANAIATHSGFNTLEGDDLFVAAELGFTPEIDGLGGGNYRVLGWHTHSGDADGAGFALSFDQHATAQLVPFFRYGCGDDEVADFEQFVSAGLGVEAPFGRTDDLFAIGLAWGDPSDDELDEETLFEMFYRIQLLANVTLTPDVQLILDPADSDDDGPVVVGGLRLQATF